MSPEPEVPVNYSDSVGGSAAMFALTVEHVMTKQEGEGNIADSKTSNQRLAGAGIAKLPEILAPRKHRERRNQSPSLLMLPDSFPDAMSPASSSATSQATSVDATFEPTIEMMVNDFDDEGTLNEEEALAALECQDPHDEIATLQEESEMPLEELLAKYSAMPRVEVPLLPPRKKAKKSSSASRKRLKSKKETSQAFQRTEVEYKEADNSHEASTSAGASQTKTVEGSGPSDIIVIESGDEDNINTEEKVDEHESGEEEADEVNERYSVTEKLAIPLQPTDCATEQRTDIFMQPPTEVVKKRRSHLLDLYPEETFNINRADGKVISLEMFYGEDEYDDEDDDEVEDEETDSDYIKKTIMVGSAYQAVIPIGLSQYGDVLPYENEDKLIWEPSQVSEREVEEYLVKARDIKPKLADDHERLAVTLDEISSAKEQVTLSTNETPLTNAVELTTQPSVLLEHNAPASVVSSDGELGGVVKDNEQALHLLVQCGYDFKEALRRKRLNAVPMTGSMSIWSEEECHKFEEGIQKFGKDFLKIRQNQVRTRSMRELVQFYYLWKKSERRDHDFANSNTVDHMDIYLNEGGDYGPNAGATTGTPTIGSATTLTARKTPTCVQKNFSIMTGGTNGALAAATTNNSIPSSPTNTTQTNSTTHNRRRQGVIAASTLISQSNNESNQTIVAIGTCLK